jgi:hypothetical protein
MPRRYFPKLEPLASGVPDSEFSNKFKVRMSQMVWHAIFFSVAQHTHSGTLPAYVAVAEPCLCTRFPRLHSPCRHCRAGIAIQLCGESRPRVLHPMLGTIQVDLIEGVNLTASAGLQSMALRCMTPTKDLQRHLERVRRAPTASSSTVLCCMRVRVVSCCCRASAQG